MLNGAIKAGSWTHNVSLTEAYRNALGQWVKDQQQQAVFSTVVGVRRQAREVDASRVDVASLGHLGRGAD